MEEKVEIGLNKERKRAGKVARYEAGNWRRMKGRENGKKEKT